MKNRDMNGYRNHFSQVWTRRITDGFSRYRRSPEFGGAARVVAAGPGDSICWLPWLSPVELIECLDAYRDCGRDREKLRLWIRVRYQRDRVWTDVAVSVTQANAMWQAELANRGRMGRYYGGAWEEHG